jgi:hypothetical protein
VGTWACPASFAPLAQTLVITENLDDSLTLSSGADGGGDTFCASDLWYYSGTTVSMKAGTSCVGPTGDEVVTVNSFKMTVTGNTLAVSANETVVSQDVAVDGAPTGTPTKSVLNLLGACTKQ